MQGRVLSLDHFAIYMKEIACDNPILNLVKYADEMTLVDCLKDEHSLTQCYLQTESINRQFKSSLTEQS